MRNPNEHCMYPHQFFQNSYSSSPPLETGSFSKLGDASNGVSNDSDTHLLLELPYIQEVLKEKDCSDSVDPSPPKHSSSSSSYEKVHKPLPFFL